MDTSRTARPSPAATTLWVAWMAIMAWFSLVREPPLEPGGLLAWDKLQHAVAYGVLAWLGGLSLRRLRPDPRWGWRVASCIAFGFGVALEGGQLLLASGRRGEWQDLAANGCGILLVYGAARQAWRLSRASTP